ncbi:J domain-containing protein [Marinicella sp. S1101]|uniref:J domain-containing protein n=1 Tax=Marinicella marina TaxID=2996016 RepID=UPI002260DA11|nr:J domain-containing protein [Marinicella marina]MCX7552851.1 J domain-containing protein [Marinicella marina]MDJ1139840.1 J domain-containing protein [Marinicella marina]
MYPWDVLGIDETGDKKTIKKAYAKLLRKYRPDEHPDKFQEINQAYQFALTLINEQLTDEAISQESPTSLSAVGVEAVDSVSIDKKNNSENAGEDDPDTNFSVDTIDNDVEHELFVANGEADLVEEILAQFHQMAFAKYNIKKDPSNWQFLEQFHSIQDLQLRDELSKELFKRVVEYNSFQLKENATLLLTQNMVQAIAAVLEWERDWHELQNTFPEHYVAHVFKLLEPQTQLSGFSFLMLRIATICLEFTVASLLAKLYMLRPWAPATESFEAITIFMFMIINIGAMTSEISLSMVQYGVGLRIYDKYLNLTDSSTDKLRALVFHLLMTPLYFIYYDSTIYLSMMLPVVAVILVINLFCWWKNKQLFHDWVSGTIMVK